MAWRVVLPSLMVAGLLSLALLRPAASRPPPPSRPVEPSPGDVLPQATDPPRAVPVVATSPARPPISQLDLLRRESFGGNEELREEVRRDPPSWWPLLFSVLRDPSEKLRTRRSILHLIAEFRPPRRSKRDPGSRADPGHLSHAGGGPWRVRRSGIGLRRPGALRPPAVQALLRRHAEGPDPVR